jgi:CheY-like chemotaxis protein
MDDEPHVLDWLVDYLEAKGYQVELVLNVDEAVRSLDERSYRVAIFDLNVPASDAVLKRLEAKSEVHTAYRGLYAAEFARTKGLRGRQVIVYSVHDSEGVADKCNRVGIQYLIKARPREFKKELDSILAFDPSAGG